MNAQFIRLAGHTRRRAHALCWRESQLKSHLHRPRGSVSQKIPLAEMHLCIPSLVQISNSYTIRLLAKSLASSSARPLNRWILKGPQRPRLGASGCLVVLSAGTWHTLPPASLSGRTYRASSVPAAIFATAPALLSDWPWIFHESSQMKSHTKKRAPIEFVKIVECVFLAALRDAQFTKGSGREQECIIYFSGTRKYCMRNKMNQLHINSNF